MAIFMIDTTGYIASISITGQCMLSFAQTLQARQVPDHISIQVNYPFSLDLDRLASFSLGGTMSCHALNLTTSEAMLSPSYMPADSTCFFSLCPMEVAFMVSANSVRMGVTESVG